MRKPVKGSLTRSDLNQVETSEYSLTLEISDLESRGIVSIGFLYDAADLCSCIV